MTNKILITILVLSILGVGGFFVYQNYSTPSPQVEQDEQVPEPLTEEEEAGLGAQLYEDVNNPGGNVPETNPFQQQVNPFEEGETNPFSGGAPNPFE